MGRGTDWATRFGEGLGVVLAPLFAAGSAARRARVFHPTGTVRAGAVVAAEGPGAAVGARLAGTALLRLSGGAWKGTHRPDLLGLAIRFRGPRPLSSAPDPADQDLVLATMRHLVLLPVAFFATDASDYLGNTYHGGLPYRVDGLGRVWIEATPLAPSPPGPDRETRLAEAVRSGRAWLRLEAVSGGDRVELATIEIGPVLAVADEAVAFDPFRAGAGIRPVGVTQGIRRAVYAASRNAWGALNPISGSRSRGV